MSSGVNSPLEEYLKQKAALLYGFNRHVVMRRDEEIALILESRKDSMAGWEEVCKVDSPYSNKKYSNKKQHTENTEPETVLIEDSDNESEVNKNKSLPPKKKPVQPKRRAPIKKKAKVAKKAVESKTARKAPKQKAPTKPKRRQYKRKQTVLRKGKDKRLEAINISLLINTGKGSAATYSLADKS